jgi:4,5:9,10-diseco-3-hydroxy-5,9,17-trioxoandrosta-1(10),2-diene-4-oate hydrolase
MGGFTALGLALDHPDRVRRLILTDSGGLGAQMQLDVRLYYRLIPERLHPLLGRRFTRFILTHDRVRRAEPPSEAEVDFYHALLTQREVVASGASAFNRWVNLTGVHLILTDRLNELDMPVLLLWGDRDIVTLYHDALVASRFLRDGQLVTFSRCGHSPFAERPDDFARVVLTWLDGIHVRRRV